MMGRRYIPSFQLCGCYVDREQPLAVREKFLRTCHPFSHRGWCWQLISIVFVEKGLQTEVHFWLSIELGTLFCDYRHDGSKRQAEKSICMELYMETHRTKVAFCCVIHASICFLSSQLASLHPARNC
jgi:hypothetical protein